MADSTKGEVQARQRNLVFNLLEVPPKVFFGTLRGALEEDLLQHEGQAFF